jgi:hypothetical protein
MLLQGRQSNMRSNGMNTRSNIYAHRATSLTSRKVALMPRPPGSRRRVFVIESYTDAPLPAPDDVAGPI